MDLFSGRQLSDFLGASFERLKSEIDAEEKDSLLNVNVDEYVDYLAEKYKVEPIVFYKEKMTISGREEMIPSERFPKFIFNVRPGRSYEKQVLTYHLPYTGNPRLLERAPSTRILCSPEVDNRGDHIEFDVINWRDDSEEIKAQADNTVDNILTLSKYSADQVEKYNQSLPVLTKEAVEARRLRYLDESRFMKSLGVPFNERSDRPKTFSVPIKNKSISAYRIRPFITPYEPEPILDETTFLEILKSCRKIGTSIETHPSVYKGKGEEALRDHFLTSLSPCFEGISGETFNRKGKTDIIWKFEGSNVFVAECKFWSGIKNFFDAITQALGYLTWRDSKAAILCFVRVKELDPVLKRIEKDVPNHKDFVKLEKSQEEGWWSYTFRLPHDPSRSVRLAVLCFHFPSDGNNLQS